MTRVRDCVTRVVSAYSDLGAEQICKTKTGWAEILAPVTAQSWPALGGDITPAQHESNIHSLMHPQLRCYAPVPDTGMHVIRAQSPAKIIQ